MNLAILGAGVSGLSLARSLSEGGFDPANFTLFEAAPIPGGLCRSRTVDGFTYDIAGGHILYSKEAEVMDWMEAETGGPPAFVSCQRNTRLRF